MGIECDAQPARSAALQSRTSLYTRLLELSKRIRIIAMKKFTHALRLAPVVLTLALAACCEQPQDPQVLIAKAEDYRNKGNYPAAIIELKNVVQKNPDHAEARYLLGIGYLDVGDAKSAEAELRRALSLGADAAKAQPALAKSLLAQGRLQEVLDATDPARIPEARDSADMLNLRGLAQLYLRRPAEATQLFDHAL